MADGSLKPVPGDPRQTMVVALIPRGLARRLGAFCDTNGEQVHEVVADAIALHLDEVEGADAGPEPMAQVLS